MTTGLPDITPKDIVEYWFGGQTMDDANKVSASQQALWWGKSSATDEHIREHYQPLLPLFEQGMLDDWRQSPSGRLALILLTDQFTRNMFRNTPRAFEYDPHALTLAIAGLERGDDKQLTRIQRVFMYMPLEHSEQIEHQDAAVAAFQSLLEDAPNSEKQTFADYLDFAIRHQQVIARFGRFPHRNDILGRKSSAEELAFLEQPGSSF